MKKTLKSVGMLLMLCPIIHGCSFIIEDDPMDRIEIGDGEDIPSVPVPGFKYRTDGYDIWMENTSVGASSFLWDFGDGTTSTEEFPMHTYSEEKTYKVKLTVGNMKGVTETLEQEIEIFTRAVVDLAVTPQKYRAGKYGRLISFDASSSRNATGVIWDFGDGTVTELVPDLKIDHEYPDYGTYTLKITAHNRYGEASVFEKEINVEKYPELLKGGSMEAEDAQYWTFNEDWAQTEDYAPAVGIPAYVAEFGCKTGPAGANGGSLRLGGENQINDGAYNCTFYQPIEVEEGDVLKVSADVRWDANSMDNGVLYFCFSEDAATLGEDQTAVLQMFNYWNVGTPLPAFDGNLAGEGLPAGSGYSGDGTGEVTYTVTKTGTIYFGVELREVWGLTYGPGVNFYFDNLSVEIDL